MTLDDFLKDSGRGAAKLLASDAGISKSHLSDIKNGREHASLDLAVRIHILTGRKVPVNKLVNPSTADALASAKGAL